MDSTSFGLDLLGLVAVGFLVFANGFFVAAEFSLVSVRRTRIAELVAQGSPSAEAVQKAIHNPDRVIAATQLGITMASLGLGWIGEPALAHLIYPLVAIFPRTVQSGLSHTISAVIAFILITFLHVVAGELTPKSIALQNPEATALKIAKPTLWTETIFKPFIYVLNGAGNFLLKLIGIKPASGLELVHSVEELKMLVTASADLGVVEQDEREMLHAIFDFGDLIARQVMIPRTEIEAVEADAQMDEIIKVATRSTYTKLPVYEDNLDQIVGIVHVKDILTAMQTPNCEHCSARELMREPIFIPETLSVGALLRQFRDNRQHIAIVMDEFGGTSGLVTLEDLLEEIVGEVSDPFDEFSPQIVPQPDGSYLIDGLTLIEVVNDQLALTLNEPDYDTIAGYVLGKLGHMPRLKDTVEGEGVRLTVEALDGMRIALVSLTRLPEESEPNLSIPPQGSS